MEQDLLMNVELDPIIFTHDLSDYDALGLEPAESSVQYVRNFARQFRPL